MLSKVGVIIPKDPKLRNLQPQAQAQRNRCRICRPPDGSVLDQTSKFTIQAALFPYSACSSFSLHFSSRPLSSALPRSPHPHSFPSQYPDWPRWPHLTPRQTRWCSPRCFCSPHFCHRSRLTASCSSAPASSFSSSPSSCPSSCSSPA